MSENKEDFLREIDELLQDDAVNGQSDETGEALGDLEALNLDTEDIPNLLAEKPKTGYEWDGVITNK